MIYIVAFMIGVTLGLIVRNSLKYNKLLKEDAIKIKKSIEKGKKHQKRIEDLEEKIRINNKKLMDSKNDYYEERKNLWLEIRLTMYIISLRDKEIS